MYSPGNSALGALTYELQKNAPQELTLAAGYWKFKIVIDQVSPFTAYDPYKIKIMQGCSKPCGTNPPLCEVCGDGFKSTT